MVTDKKKKNQASSVIRKALKRWLNLVNKCLHRQKELTNRELLRVEEKNTMRFSELN